MAIHLKRYLEKNPIAFEKENDSINTPTHKRVISAMLCIWETLQQFLLLCCNVCRDHSSSGDANIKADVSKIFKFVSKSKAKVDIYLTYKRLTKYHVKYHKQNIMHAHYYDACVSNDLLRTELVRFHILFFSLPLI